MIAKTQLTQAEVDALFKKGAGVDPGRPKSIHALLWEQINFPAMVAGETLTLPIENQESYNYIRMRLSRLAQDTGAAFKTRKMFDGTLKIVCMVAPNFAQLSAVLIKAADNDNALILEPNLVKPATFNEESNLFLDAPDQRAAVYQPIFELTEAPTLEAYDICAVCTHTPCTCDKHPNRTELHSWLKQQKKGWQFCYRQGQPGCEVQCELIEEWANQLDNIAAAFNPNQNCVDMEYVD